MSETQCHLFVLIHGLGSGPSSLMYMENAILQTFPSRTACLRVTCNSHWGGTLDGVDKAGTRVADEIETFLKEHTDDFHTISLVGHSAGGLFARYAAGILYERDFFNNVTPRYFVTLGTPWLGSRDWGGVISWGVSKIGRTGQQLMVTDGSDPLLVRLSLSPYINALDLFQKRIVIAARNDRKVGVCTASLRWCPTSEKENKQGDSSVPREVYPHVMLREYVQPKMDKDKTTLRDIEQQMLSKLEELQFERIEVKASKLLAHEDIIVSSDIFNSCGKDIVAYLMAILSEEFVKDSTIQSPSTVGETTDVAGVAKSLTSSME